MNDDDVLLALGTLFLILIAVAVVNAVTSVSCSSKWAHSGFQVDYGIMKGCTISKDGKTFIPEENYREFGDQK